jgi:hypothetical protein
MYASNCPFFHMCIELFSIVAMRVSHRLYGGIPVVPGCGVFLGDGGCCRR